jgi:signal transduction histidine kinase/ABC-type amino acid transport substrate-binding protein/ActR/RegA family two-component response regulator
MAWLMLPVFVLAGHTSAQEPQPDSRTRTIVIGTEAAYPPYSFIDSANNLAGYNVEVSRAVARATGLDVVVRMAPWSQLRADLEAGRIDAICGMYYSPQRDEKVDFTQPFAVIHHAIFAGPDMPPIKDISELAGRRLAVMRGDIMHDYAVSVGFEEQLVQHETLPGALRTVEEGKADAALGAQLPGLHWVRVLNLANIHVTGQPLAPKDYCFAVGEGRHDLRERLAEGIAILRASGRLDEIRVKWLGDLDVPKIDCTSGRMVRIGVLAKRGKDTCQAKWGLTADYLTRRIPAHQFEIVPLAFNEVDQAVLKEQVDFILVNPAVYVRLEHDYRVSRIITLKNIYRGEPTTHFAGLLICRSDRSDIRRVSDVRGRRVAGVAVTGFGGWLMQAYEMKRHGITPEKDLASVEFCGTQDGVVQAVANGQADVGAIRSGILEAMQAEGKINIDDFRILYSQDRSSDQLYGHSTQSYPEWPLARLQHTSSELAEDVAASLLQLKQNDSAARSAGIAGWTVPGNYQSVHDCLLALRVPPYEHYGKVSLGEVLGTYWPWILVATGGFMVVLTAAVIAFRLNGRLKDTLEQKQQTQEQLTAANAKLHDAIQRAQDLAAQAEQAARTKSAFLANMSHEIRTPLTAILGYAELMSDTDEDEASRHSYLQQIGRNGRHLMNLINDILDLSKIEAGQLTLETRPCNIPLMIADVISMMRLRADRQGVELAAEFPTELPETIQTDEYRLRQVLVNLVGNAIKFTVEGSVRLRCSFDEAALDGEPALRISVIDTGIGMSSDVVERLGEAFLQADASTTREFGGTGLGLAICRRLIDGMNGKLRIKSESGKGSTFEVILPTGPLDGVAMLNDPAAETAKRSQESQAAGETPSLRGVRVLLAEDNPVNQHLIRRLLEKAHAEVYMVTDGQQAIEQADAKSCHVILMDMHMPKVDGYSATRSLRSQGYSRPIIALTANALENDRQRCLDVGCDDYLAKPVNRTALLQTVADYAAIATKTESIFEA